MKHTASLVISFVVLIGGVSLASFLGYRAYEESKRHNRIAEEIRSLQEEANRVDEDNRRLRDRIEYLQSDSFREGEAKRMLEYQRPNETVVVIDDPSTAVAGSTENLKGPVESRDAVQNDSRPNYKKWWDIFFGS